MFGYSSRGADGKIILDLILKIWRGLDYYSSVEDSDVVLN
jgi:hypothetical protein